VTDPLARTFFRAHGLGNDYLVWEGDPAVVTPEWVRRVCDRHTGVGSDGVLVPSLSVPFAGAGAETAVRIFNPDGSEAEKSGNGVRIYALWWSRRTGQGTFSVGTLGGVVRVQVYGYAQQDGGALSGAPAGARRAEGGVTADMGLARLGAAVELCGFTAWPVDIGNPHRVILTVPNDWRMLGANIEVAVPGRTNVQFVDVVDRTRVNARIWERGAGRTLASGSSASAIARVVTALGLCDSPVDVGMEGGTLRVAVEPDGRCTIDGPIVAIGRVELDPGWG
jgi:diaminopimelate epimerase